MNIYLDRNLAELINTEGQKLKIRNYPKLRSLSLKQEMRLTY